ncbi:MAG: extracellular solute-binding protein [Nocardioidaceae bacterium]|nr:extracellular solute-binding protein [Nocardioidaceae bacterium]
MTPSLARWFARSAAASVLVLAASACAPGSESEEVTETSASDVETDVSAMGDLTLTVWDQEVRGGQNEQIEALNEKFMQTYPNVTIERVSRSFEDLNKTLRLAITSNDAPDVVQANNGRSIMGAFVEAGQLRSLDGYSDVYGWEERFTEEIRALASYSDDGVTFGDGSLYGVPQTGELVGVWYSQSRLDDLGIEAPQTTAEFEDALAAAAEGGETPIQFGNKEGWPGIHDFGFVQNQFVPADQIRDLGFGVEGASWTSAENEQAAETIAGWAEQGYFTDGFNGLDYDPAWQAFAEGEGAFLVAGTWLLADLTDAMGDDLRFMLPPVGATGELAVTGGTGLPFAITASSEQADAAAAYLDFITSPEAMVGIGEAGNLPVYGAGSLPADGATADVLDAWATAGEQAAIVPYLDYATPDFYDLLTAQVQDLLAGSQPPDDFLATLEEEYTAFTSSGG